MRNGKAIGSVAKLLEMVVAHANLPQYVFSRKFARHLFFDADISSSDALISAVQKIANTDLGSQTSVAVFSQSDRALLGLLEIGENWSATVNKIGGEMRNSGDCNGLIFVEAEQKWAVYQGRPIDVGVFAFDGNKNFQEIVRSTGDYFFDIEDIASWLSGSTQRDIDLVNTLGRGYLVALMKNYS